MKPTITVVSLGPGDHRLLTLQTLEAIRGSRRLILRTARHRTAAWLAEEGVAYEDFDALYDQYEDFDELHRTMAQKLWQAAESSAVTFAVIDAATDGAVRALRASRPVEGKVTVLPGVTMADSCLALLPEEFEQSGSVRILPAIDALQAAPDPATPLLITEIWDRVLAGELKLRLTDVYGDESAACLFPSSVKINRKPLVLPLLELDRQKTYDHTVCLYIPAVDLHHRDRYCFDDLLRVMHTLRQRCPWDGEQTHESLRKYLIEEAYEAASAIDDEDWAHVADELGDVLLQVVFHAHIGEETGTMELGEITTDICRKMIDRHRHIFGSDVCEDAEAVVENWEKIKKEQRGFTTQSQVLQDVSRGLPPLMRAEKVQKKARQVGFDWDDPRDALQKVEEEAREVRQALDEKDMAHLTEEVGDLFFSCVNAARLSGVSGELALMQATEKFVRRFTRMENAVLRDGKALKDLTIAEMDVYWDSIKHDSE